MIPSLVSAVIVIVALVYAGAFSAASVGHEGRCVKHGLEYVGTSPMLNGHCKTGGGTVVPSSWVGAE